MNHEHSIAKMVLILVVHLYSICTSWASPASLASSICSTKAHHIATFIIAQQHTKKTQQQQGAKIFNINIL